MTKVRDGVIVVLVIGAAVAAVLLKPAAEEPPAAASAAPVAATSAAKQPAPPAQARALPRLVDLGAQSCVPCKMMAPILEELKRDYAGVFETEFVDVWQDQESARRYGLRVIPTQIFFDAEGKEVFRHEGYFSREDILETWKQHGVDVSSQSGADGR